MADNRKGSARQRPQGRHYREVARKLRNVARECIFPNAQRELLTIARRYERKAEHLDRRALTTGAAPFG